MKYKVGDQVKVRTSSFDFGTIEEVLCDDARHGSYSVRMATPSRALHHYYGDQIEPNTAANWGAASQASQQSQAIGTSLNDPLPPKKLPVGSRVWVKDCGGFEGVLESYTAGYATVLCKCHKTLSDYDPKKVALFDKFWNEKRAHRQGKAIEFRSPPIDVWIDCGGSPSWIDGYEYRVKPAAPKVKAEPKMAVGVDLGKPGGDKTAVSAFEWGNGAVWYSSTPFTFGPVPDEQNPVKLSEKFCIDHGIISGALARVSDLGTTGRIRLGLSALLSRVMRDAHASGYEAGTKVADRALQPKIDRIAELEKLIDGHQKAANAANWRIKQIEEIKRLEGELDDSRDSGKSLMKQITDNAMLKAAEPMIIVKSQQLTDVSTIDMAAELAKRGFTNFGQAVTQVDVTRANGVVTTHKA